MSTIEKKEGALDKKHCLPCEGGVPPLTEKAIQPFLAQFTFPWRLDPDLKKISYDFHFKNYYQTMAFVNAVAWIANQENHHPDMEVGYNYCVVNYTTHAIKGLSENDFICAAKVNALEAE